MDDSAQTAEDLTTNNAFDAYAARFDWAYDNGGKYRDEHWDWYAGKVTGLVLMRQKPDRVCVVHFDGLKPTELWSGRVRTTKDFDTMLASITSKVAEG